jgi:crossover junction endodeoxyribonuclease RuvC
MDGVEIAALCAPYNPRALSPRPHNVPRILGIDPGSQRTGIGIIDLDAAGRARHVHHATLHLTGNESFALRLKQIFDELGALIDAHRPDEVAIEKVFAQRNNAESVLKLGQARGAAICAVVARGLSVQEYGPKEIKQAVTGSGGADKVQVQHMVALLLALAERPQADAADALAIAITHAHTRGTAARLGLPRTSWRRR